MSYNSFDYYQQIRQYQLHIQRITNPQTGIPVHKAYSSSKPKIEQAREAERNRKLMKIQRQNQIIMHKLVSINKKKSSIASSASNHILPPLKKQFFIPVHQNQNNLIAKKIIECKPFANTDSYLKRHQLFEQRKQSISKYNRSSDGAIVNRKKYLAEFILLKKMRNSELLKASI